jgi:hypothetical protein
MTTFSGGTRLAFRIFFASHIFVTLFMTAQTVVPWIYPDFLVGLLPFYVSQFDDTLMTRPFDLWFKSFVVFEVLVQVPTRTSAHTAVLVGSRPPAWFTVRM